MTTGTDSVPRSVERAAQALLVAIRLARACRDEPEWRVAIDAASLVRSAKALDRINEAQCIRPTTERDERAQRRHEDLVQGVALKYGAYVHFGGDPRGPAVRLYWLGEIPTGADPEANTDKMFAVL